MPCHLQARGDIDEGVEMSQRVVEQVLGRLVTDETFREAFFRDPGAAILAYAAELTAAEMDALRHVPRSALARLCERLDDRICRLRIPAAGHEGIRG
jgi:hypothetical protein